MSERSVVSRKGDSTCLVQYIDNPKTVTSQDEQHKFNACLPDELVIALKQAELPKEYLGPGSKKLQPSSKTQMPPIIRKTDNLWHLEKQREKYKFLTEQTVCSCGAGKDISFLYDAITKKPEPLKPVPSRYDRSGMRGTEPELQKEIEIAESLIPEEYRVVKSRGVWPLKVMENKYTTLPIEHLDHVTTFPSLKPTARTEVLQLKHTMDSLLDKAGINSVDQKGPTQLHNLLEILKQEQDIYNIIFHEVIRQVTVDCKERGEILAKLRERYANLLSRVPRQIKSLHEEVIAQRALDRRLTDELTNFKTTITNLTDELCTVREHDQRISTDATTYREDLENALNEAKKNASLLTEYHDLYELQRKRLEKLVENLTEERELWCNSAYSISLKVTEENKINTAKRLNVAERSWSKLARHFAILLSDRDTKTIAEVQKYAEEWRELVKEYREELMSREDEARKQFSRLETSLQHVRNDLGSLFNSEGKLAELPDQRKTTNIYGELRNWQDVINKQSERFSGDSVLISEERLHKAEYFVNKWMEATGLLLSRHASSVNEQKAKEFTSHRALNTDIHQLHFQYRIRSEGDNGVSKILMNITTALEIWNRKLADFVKLSQDDSDDQKKTSKRQNAETDWKIFYEALNEWILSVKKASKCVGVPIKEEPTSDKDFFKVVDHENLLSNIYQWLSSTTHYIESQDGCIIDQVSHLHSEMIHWMVQVLIRLAPDAPSISDEAKQMIYMSTSSTDALKEIGDRLMGKVASFTRLLVSCCAPIESEINITSNPNAIPDPEKEGKTLKTLATESSEWIYSAKLLFTDLTNDRTLYPEINLADLSRGIGQHRKQQSQLQIEHPEVHVEGVLESSTVDTVNQVSSPLKRPVTGRRLKMNGERDGDSNRYEVLDDDFNTKHKSLNNISVSSLSEASDKTGVGNNQNKLAVFNAYKTIEKLQEQIITTEERAQVSETRVSELEVLLKETTEKLRALEKKNELEMNLIEQPVHHVEITKTEIKIDNSQPVAVNERSEPIIQTNKPTTKKTTKGTGTKKGSKK